MKLISTYAFGLALSMAPIVVPATPANNGANSSTSSSATAARAANQAKFCQQYRARLAAGNHVIPKAEAICQGIGK